MCPKSIFFDDLIGIKKIRPADLRIVIGTAAQKYGDSGAFASEEELIYAMYLFVFQPVPFQVDE